MSAVVIPTQRTAPAVEMDRDPFAGSWLPPKAEGKR